MSVSLKQLTAMADIVELLAMETRQLIALRKIIVRHSAEHVIATSSRTAARPRTKGTANQTARRVACTKARIARPPASA
jgi:hypothetical protein